jgi:hypothetical protein
MKKAVKKRGRPPGVRPRPGDLDILLQVHIWLTWPQNKTKSFDHLVYWASVVHWASRGYSPPAADRTTLPKRLKRLHAAVAANPTKFGFLKWVSQLNIKQRRIAQPKQSGAAGAAIRRAVRALEVDLERTRDELKSQTRPPED